MKWDVNIAAENLTGKLALIKWQVPAMLIANQIWWFQAWMVQILFYQCRLFSFQASIASSAREEDFFLIKLKNFWLFQSCLSKLNTIALGVGSQFSSVKLRESKEEQQAASTYTQGRTGFHEFFFSLFFTNSCISWCETLRAILFSTPLLWCHHLPFSKVVVLTILQKRLTGKWALKVCAPLCADPEEALHTMGWTTLWRSLISKKTKLSPDFW